MKLPYPPVELNIATSSMLMGLVVISSSRSVWLPDTLFCMSEFISPMTVVVVWYMAL